MGEAAFRIQEKQAVGGERVFAVEIPRDCAYFDGHFPRRPILPAVGQLRIVADLLALEGGPRSIASVDALRFSEPIGPGDCLLVRLDVNGPRVRFEIRRGESPISQGTLGLAEESAG